MKFSEMPYERPDMSTLKEQFAALTERLQNAPDYAAARAAAARPRPPCGREGVIAPGFSGTGSVSKGDAVPLRPL